MTYDDDDDDDDYTNELGDQTDYVVYPDYRDDTIKFSSYYNESLHEMINEGFTTSQMRLLNIVMKTKDAYYNCYDINDEEYNAWYGTWDIMEEGIDGKGVDLGDMCSDDNSTHYRCNICNHESVISNKKGVFNIVEHGLAHYEEYKNLESLVAFI